jgi:hypothetical protein
MKTLFFLYLASMFLLWISHRLPNWISSAQSEQLTGHAWADRLARRLATREHQPSLISDIIVAGFGFLVIYIASHFDVPKSDSEWPRGDLVVAGLCCIGFCLLVIFGVGANIANSPLWSRSYPLIAIYLSGIVIIFAKLYVLLGVVDGKNPTTDYSTALYLSLITVANLGSGDVVPSVDSRFVAATESLIGYASLAFLAALLFTTMQRGMRRQIKAYNRRRRALIQSTPQNSV